MPNQFNQATVQQYGGVAWAKQQVDMANYGDAIGSQITGYQQVHDSLNNIVNTLNNATASLQAAWDGDAATAAAQTFTETSNHAQNVMATVNNTITQLNSARSAAQAAKQAMLNVPNEKPIPSGNFFTHVANTFSDLTTGTDPVKQAQQHNTAARTQAADVLNQLSSHYDNAANNMTSIASGGQDAGFTPSTPASSGSFNLGNGSYGGGSGAAAGYRFTSHSGGGAVAGAPSTGGVGGNGVFYDAPPPAAGTVDQGVIPTAPPSTSVPPGIEGIGTATTTTTPGPIFGPPVTGLPLPPNEEINAPGGPGGMFGDGANEGTAGGKSRISSSNVFGEDGFGDGSSGGTSRRSASNLGGGLDAEEGLGGAGGETGAGAGNGAVNGEQSAMGGMGGRRGGGGSSSEEELGSSKYSRGRFFGGEEPGSGEKEWVQPSIGGNESLLVKDNGRAAGTGRVASAYDGATDADGKPLQMMRGFGRRGAGHDEDDERGERPDYLKEDPEWWQSAQRVAPPVIE